MEQGEQGEVVAQDQDQNELDAHLPDEPIVHEQSKERMKSPRTINWSTNLDLMVRMRISKNSFKDGKIHLLIL
jgi:hypothetical protein